MNGNIIAVIVKPTVVMPMLAREKLRSRNRLSGTSGSRVVRVCHHTKTTRETVPSPSSSGTEIGP